jgi:hypothetical protein
MPILRFDILEGRSDAEITALLDASHPRGSERFFRAPA